ncbi:MAG: IS1634 family transposase [Gammaproteobacteria bacterium]
MARLLDPGSKLATVRGLGGESAATSLGESLEVEAAQAEDLYAAMDWLHARQAEVEKKLAQHHLHDGALVLYDVSSTYFEGRCCPLAQLGHFRDGKRDKLQIVFGLLGNREGCPIAVEVFEGPTGDPKTLASQLQKLRTNFGLLRVVLVGDRGMITEARIREELKPLEGVHWITALRARAIRALVEAKDIQLSLFDAQDLAEITSSAYPGERLIVCKNPLLAQQRTRQREALLQATERALDKIVAATQRTQRALKGQAPIGLRVGKVIGRFKMAKHFTLTITEDRFTYARDAQRIHEEAALDGLYVVRTSVPHETLEPEETVRAYKDLAHVERAFRSYKSVDLKVRPIYLTSPIASARMSSCVCSPTTWSGLCARPSRRSSLTMTISRAPRNNVPPSLPRPKFPPKPNRRRTPNAPKRASLCIASRHFWPILPRSPRTVFNPNSKAQRPSITSPGPPPYNARPSNSWA